ncbi:hypothetical protein [Spirochaeta isovalerica]|uniref:Uncharacterized protein n=1 Tax=Spirochaeta isovalerica TaxID=150 RepID=A0A841RD13_9SPIO|nr:hypothetical protein [Spirochaeta isovalerica]MBB6481546.1 hypothetical protein [Spirochaeta isovalerica]
MGRHKYSRNPIIEDLESFSIEILSPILKLYFDQHSLFNQNLDALPGYNNIKITMTSDSSIAYLHGTHNGHSIYTYVEAVQCPFGNYRFYFVCRFTGYRVTTLYLAPSNEYLSRYTIHAVYRTQREHNGQFFLINRARDLRNQAIKYQKKGRIKKMKICNQISDKLEVEFYRTKISYFENSLNQLK